MASSASAASAGGAAADPSAALSSALLTKAEREALLAEEGGGASRLHDFAEGADQRSRLLSATARLGNATGRVQESRRAMLQTEQLGASILQDLHGQRQQLVRAHDTLQDVDDDISRARRLLNTMITRMNRNKWITALIFSLLFLAIALVIFFRLRGR